MEAIPEAKRTATRVAAPSRSAPAAPPAAPAPSVAAPSFQSEGNNKAMGPAPGEETFEELHERTGLTCADILTKKLVLKKVGLNLATGGLRAMCGWPWHLRSACLPPVSGLRARA